MIVDGATTARPRLRRPARRRLPAVGPGLERRRRARADRPAGGAFDSALNVLEPAADQVIVYLRSGPRGRLGDGEGERRAQVVIDHHDP